MKEYHSSSNIQFDYIVKTIFVCQIDYKAKHMILESHMHTRARKHTQPPGRIIIIIIFTPFKISKITTNKPKYNINSHYTHSLSLLGQKMCPNISFNNLGEYFY